MLPSRTDRQGAWTFLCVLGQCHLESVFHAVLHAGTFREVAKMGKILIDITRFNDVS